MQIDSKATNNTYFWGNLDSLESYVIAYAPSREQAIANVLKVMKQEWDSYRGAPAPNDDLYSDWLEEMLANLEAELNAKEPKINQVVHIINHS